MDKERDIETDKEKKVRKRWRVSNREREREIVGVK